jgi:hypothetical protein
MNAAGGRCAHGDALGGVVGRVPGGVPSPSVASTSCSGEHATCLSEPLTLGAKWPAHQVLSNRCLASDDVIRRIG